ncbi:MAG: thiol peroxidase [Bdellovibrionales bacterium]|nr:thiol peroxidase [Bdellovibrionales bacterium]
MNTSNQNIHFKGEKTTVAGRELSVGDKLPAFKLTANDLSDLDSSTFAGKKLIVCSVPSLDTPVCANETKRFNSEAASLGKDVAVLVVSMDLPFAQKRWCGAEGADQVTTASDYKYRSFGEDFGVVWQGPQLLARAVFVADPSGTLKHVEYVGDISQEPDYDAALAALKNI